MRATLIAPTLLAALALAACSAAEPRSDSPTAPTKEASPMSPAASKPGSTPATPGSASTPGTPDAARPRTEIATLAGGCFWCMEAVYEQIPGVLDARSGFMGGTVANPTYEQVCEGDTGAAEVIQVTFDPSKVGYELLLEWFWKSHDPTTLNRQGNDVGTQYRSAIFVHSDAQRVAAEASKAAVQERFRSPVVTEIATAGAFTEADPHHQDYYRLNSSQGYCQAVIRPKLHKLGLKE